MGEKAALELPGARARAGSGFRCCLIFVDTKARLEGMSEVWVNGSRAREQEREKRHRDMDGLTSSFSQKRGRVSPDFLLSSGHYAKLCEVLPFILRVERGAAGSIFTRNRLRCSFLRRIGLIAFQQVSSCVHASCVVGTRKTYRYRDHTKDDTPSNSLSDPR